MFKYYLFYWKQVFLLTLLFLLLELVNFSHHRKLNAQIIGVQEVKGVSGGSINSQDCGYIAQSPNHVLNLRQKVDYLRVNLQSSSGQPTLLILGPGSTDRFCLLGDSNLGVKTELAGVWEPGKYLIYVGDHEGSQNPFILNISTQK
jgi:hypothetical protein